MDARIDLPAGSGIRMGSDVQPPLSRFLERCHAEVAGDNSGAVADYIPNYPKPILVTSVSALRPPTATSTRSAIAMSPSRSSRFQKPLFLRSPSRRSVPNGLRASSELSQVAKLSIRSSARRQPAFQPNGQCRCNCMLRSHLRCAGRTLLGASSQR